MNEVGNPQGLLIRASQLACMVEHANPEDTRWLDALKEGAENVRAALASEPEPLIKLGGIDLVYNPDDERHWLKVGLLLERGNEDINDCTVIITRKPDA